MFFKLRQMLICIAALLCFVAPLSLRSQQPRPTRKVILMIGDGMGYSEITLARNYYYGAAGRLEMDAFTETGSATTYSLLESKPALPNYVTDSAAGGTAWATGKKTSNGRISTAAGTNEPLKTILELAQSNGVKVGDVSTAELTDATPAVLGSHVSSRKCQGPADMADCLNEKKGAGGLGSIAEQLIDHRIDVLLGGGKQRFDQIIDGGPQTGKSVLDQAKETGYSIVTDLNGLNAARAGERVLGLFNSGNMSLEWSGDPAIPFPGSGPQKCHEFSRTETEPSLMSMTLKAISLLGGDDLSSRFFLQIEGAQIDKNDHAAKPCEQIGETIAFDNAIKLVLDYARVHPDTLVIVTADHAQTSQIVPVPEKGSDPVPGYLSTLITTDKAPLTVAYSTNTICCAGSHFMEHTGSQVRLAAFGPGAEQFSGHHDMTEVFDLIRKALDLK